MNKLTKIQFTTFIDIISQDNYRAITPEILRKLVEGLR